MVLRGILGVVGVVLVLVGAVFTGQGTNLIHGSSMSGHGGYAALGVVLLVIGLALLAWTWRRRLRSTI
jgi:protein-S-isoprenylcysteine O-methyltransferase Ste14